MIFQNTLSITVVKFPNFSWICVPVVTITFLLVYLAIFTQAFIAKKKKIACYGLVAMTTTTQYWLFCLCLWTVLLKTGEMHRGLNHLYLEYIHFRTSHRNNFVETYIWYFSVLCVLLGNFIKLIIQAGLWINSMYSCLMLQTTK